MYFYVFDWKIVASYENKHRWIICDIFQVYVPFVMTQFVVYRVPKNELNTNRSFKNTNSGTIIKETEEARVLNNGLETNSH